MTSEDIRIDAQLLCGFTIDSAVAFKWVKDAAKYVLRLHPLAATKKTVEVSFNEDKQTYQIEEELARIENITLKDERYPIRQIAFDCDELGNITFWYKGDYVITYRYVPVMPQTASGDLPMPDKYAEPIKYYVAARMRGRVYGQGDSDAQNYDMLFLQYENDADISMNRTNKRHRRMPVRY